MEMQVARRLGDPQQPLARVSTHLPWQSDANDGANFRRPKFPESNGENYAQLGDGSGQEQAPRRGRRRRRRRPEEPEGNNPSLWLRFLGFVTSIVSVIGITDQLPKAQSPIRSRIIGLFVATLFIGAGSVLAAEYASWHRTGRVMCYICSLMLVAELVYAITACTEFVKKIKELFQELAPLWVWVMRALGIQQGMNAVPT